MIYEVVGEGERAIAAEVEAYVVADFLSPVNGRVTAVAAPIGSDRELAPDEEWIYRRREDDSS